MQSNLNLTYHFRRHFHYEIVCCLINSEESMLLLCRLLIEWCTNSIRWHMKNGWGLNGSLPMIQNHSDDIFGDTSNPLLTQQCKQMCYSYWTTIANWLYKLSFSLLSNRIMKVFVQCVVFMSGFWHEINSTGENV